MSDEHGRIPEEVIDDIAARADIVDVISRYVPLKRHGASYKGLCPFHNEKTPSFTVSPHKGFFYCFGCGAGGSVFNFLMQIEQWTFPEAVRYLAKETGVDIPEKKMTSADHAKIKQKERFRSINELAAHFYEAALTAAPGTEARAYLESRGINEEVRKTFRLGVCVEGWDHLSQWLQKKGVSKKDLLAVGLSLQRRDGTLYDRFRERLMFPIIDETGYVIGFGGRILEAGKAPQKYLNTSETELFHKSQTLYGINHARKAIREADLVLVVEGYMDVIACHQAGVKNIVAPLGTALTEEQIKHLMRHTYRMVLAFDGDTAGRKAAMRSSMLVESLGATARILQLPDSMDPDEYIKKHGVESFKERVLKATPSILFQLQYLSEGLDLTLIEEKLRILDEILPFIAQKSKPADRAEAIIQTAKALDMTEQTVREEWSYYQRTGMRRQKHLPEETAEPQKKQIDLPKRSGVLLAMCFLQPELIDKIEELEGSVLFDIRVRRLYDFMKDCRLEGRSFTIHDIPELYMSSLLQFITSLEENDGVKKADFDRYLLEQRYDYATSAYQLITEKLSRLDGSDASKEQEILEHLKMLLSLKTALEQALGKEL